MKNRKALALTLLLTPLMMSATPSSAETDNQFNNLKTEAKGQTKAFATDLKSVLKQGMKASGPEGAIALCNTQAPAITSKHNSDEWTITRTSLKVRNPSNKPDARLEKILNDFEVRKTNGEEVKSMAHAEVIGDTFYFTKAIPTAPVCEKCHGTNINEKTLSVIDKLYPDDKARGFKAGDIRGAFVLSKKIKGKKITNQK